MHIILIFFSGWWRYLWGRWQRTMYKLPQFNGGTNMDIILAFFWFLAIKKLKFSIFIENSKTRVWEIVQIWRCLPTCKWPGLICEIVWSLVSIVPEATPRYQNSTRACICAWQQGYILPKPTSLLTGSNHHASTGLF